MNTNSNKLLYDILVDDDFINYALDPTASLNTKWRIYFESHPEQLPIAHIAKKIITGENKSCELTSFEMKELELEIMGSCGVLNFN